MKNRITKWKTTRVKWNVRKRNWKGKTKKKME